MAVLPGILDLRTFRQVRFGIPAGIDEIRPSLCINATSVNIKPFLLERHFAQYEFKVPYQLSCSDCEPLTLNELLAMASPDSIRLWENLTLSYTESAGHPLLRKEISFLYGGVNPDGILVCVPEEGIFLVMNVLLNPGDHLVVISPSYQSLHDIAPGLGCRVSAWEADDSNTYRIETLKSLVNEKTRMVVINFPHNPTGAQISRIMLEGIAGFCDKAGIYLFSDEMYRGLEPDPGERLPCAASLTNWGVALSGMSKSFALPGLRIGWLVSRNPVILEKLIRLKDYTTICASAPAEILAIIALQNHERILARNLAIIQKNISLVNAFAGRNHGRVSWIPPAAGSVALLELSGGNKAEELCRDLLEKKGVLAVGSHLFNLAKPSLRLGLGRIDFPEALERLEEVLEGRDG